MFHMETLLTVTSMTQSAQHWIIFTCHATFHILTVTTFSANLSLQYDN